MTEREKLSRKYTLMFAGIQGTFWMFFCVVCSNATLYLQTVGFSNMEVGLVLCIGNLMGAVGATLLSSLADKSRVLTARRQIYGLFVLQFIILILDAAFTGKTVLFQIIYMFFIAVSIMINSLNLKLYADLEHAGIPINYGFARGTGSFCFVILSTVLGIVFRFKDVFFLPYLGVALTVLQLIFHVILTKSFEEPERRAEGEKEKSSSLMVFFMENKRFTLMLFGIALIFFAHNTVGNFNINVVRNVGGGPDTMSFMNAFMALTEIPVMLAFGKINEKIRSHTLLRVSYGAFMLKQIAVTLAFSVPTLFMAFVLQAPSFAVFTACIVVYVNAQIPYKDAAKAQSLAYNMTTVASVLSSLIAGPMYDVMPVVNVLIISCIVCAAGMVLACIGVKKSA